MSKRRRPSPAAWELIWCATQAESSDELMLLAVWVGFCADPPYDTPDRRRVCEAIGTTFAILSVTALGPELGIEAFEVEVSL